MNEFISENKTEHESGNFVTFPSKPTITERKQNAVSKSLISLGVYALLFYFLFDQNVVMIATILLVIIIHEMGHFALMKLFNYSNVKIFIVPLLGAYTTGIKQKVSQWQLSLIILAGPIPGIIIGVLLYFLNSNTENETIKMLSYSFILLNLFNCLPFHPLDGGRLIETMFFKENHVIRLAFGIISIIGLLFLLLFSFNLVLLVIPIFIALELRNEIKHQKIREYLRNEKVNYTIEYDELSNKDYWLIRDCILLSFQKKYNGILAGDYQYSLLEPVLVQHVKSVLKVDLKNDLSIVKKIFLLLVYLSVFVVSAYVLKNMFID